jgi:hypothetical protein
MELKLFNTTDNCEGADTVYNLSAVVVHVGSGPNHGACACFYSILISAGAASRTLSSPTFLSFAV